MDEIRKFRKISGKQYSLITLIIHDESIANVINFINKQLEIVNNIKDIFKKKMANDTLYNLKCHIENEQSDQINKIYLVSEKEINKFALTKQQINTLNKYKKNNIFYKVDEKYYIDYIIDIFTDFTFFRVLELDKKNVIEYDVNSTKKLQINKISVNSQIELVDLLNENVDLVHGSSTFLKNLTTDILFFNKKLSNDEVLEEIYKLKIQKSHDQIKYILDNINNPEYENKIIFGTKETKQYTELSMISKLFIHESIYRRFLNKYREYINFTVVEIKNLEYGDISDTLKKEYDCCVGELYYKKNF